MAEEKHCPQCRAKLPADAPEGLCPRCLLKPGWANELDITVDHPSITEGPGTKIGHYELLELIGEGGMGLVYLAEQKEPVKRKVAFKIVKLGMDTKQVVARFEAERQTLALLEHPNIAHVFDAGTTDAGRPYFVMEYVEGKSVTKYCDEHKLSVEERLELFKQVCEGVHHAHQKGIIHRDIKPSNILVSIHGDRVVPKIIDFGIAKAITQPLTKKTSFTEHGQLLGTPEYMSPEQAEMSYQDVDTRSDIYSLGVLLYELLTGATPFDAKRLREGGIDHIQQVICQEEPRTPSARLTSLGDKAKAVAERRRTQIITLTRRLHRELEWIPMKAMRKDRTRRYRSASELADDIQNYLIGAPLIAGPESAVYRTRKFVRKHAGSVAMVALVAIAIVIGLVASIVMGCRAEQARQKEATARKQVEQALVRAENAERVAQEQRKLAEQQRKLAEERAEDYRRSLYFNRIALAETAYRNSNMQRLRELLELCPADLRGWEWHRLNHVSDQASMTLQGHSERVYSVAFSPDDKRIVSSSKDKTIKIWDAATGAELMTLRGHSNQVYGMAISSDGKHIVSDGKRIVSGSADGTVKVWDAATGDELKTLCGHGDRVESVAFSPDGGRIVSSSRNGTIKVWDVAIDRERVILAGPQGGEGFVAFSPDGTRIVSVTGNNATIKAWDVATGTELTTLRGRRHGFLSAAYSPDGSRIVSGSCDNTIKVWDAATGVELMCLRGHKGWVLSIAFSPDGKRIVSCSMEDKTIKVWDVATGGELVSLGHNSFVTSVAFGPDGERIVAGSSDKTVGLWDASTGAELMTLRGHTSAIRAVAFSPDGKYIVSGSENGTIKICDAGSGKELISVHGHTSRLRSVGFSPDGKRVISGSHDGTLKLWDAATGVEVMTLRGYGSAIFSPDGKAIAFGTTLLEAAAPPNGYGPRRTGAASRKLVGELYEEYGFYEEVIDKLNTDKTLAEPVRKVALQIANARLWEDAGRLNQESREVVSSPGMAQAFLEEAEKLFSVENEVRR